MPGAFARSPAALDCVYDECRVHADVHADGKAPAEVLVGADGHGNFFVQLLHVVAVARQVTVGGAKKWARRLNAQQGSNETWPERKSCATGPERDGACSVAWQSSPASHGNLPQVSSLELRENLALHCTIRRWTEWEGERKDVEIMYAQQRRADWRRRTDQHANSTNTAAATNKHHRSARCGNLSRSLVRVLHTPAKGTQTRTRNKMTPTVRTRLSCLVSSTTSHSATVWFVWFGLVQCALFLLPSFIHAKSNLANKAVLYKTALHTWMEGWKSIQVCK
jgi:hypothetical protein